MIQRFFPRLFPLVLALCALALVVFPAFARQTAPQQAEGVYIDFPPSSFVVSGTVDIFGAIEVPNVRSYILEITDTDGANAIWTPITLTQTTVPATGILGQWNTTQTADGVYRLRVVVFLTSGQSLITEVADLRVQNEGAAVQPAVPTAEPTPEPPQIVPRPQVVNPLPIFVGGQLDTFDDEAVALMQDAGMTWIKWQIPYVIGDANLFNVARDRINYSHQNGMYAMLSIKGSKDEMAAVGFEEYFRLYAEFTGQIAALQPDAIQIWNEMNLDREWPLGTISPDDYTDLLRQSYQAIKATDPRVVVITGAPAPTGAEGAFGLDRVWNDDRYYAGMAAAGAGDFSDCIGIHYNEGILPPTARGGDPRGEYPTYYLPYMIERAQYPFTIGGRTGERLCFSELGYLSPDGYGQLPAGFAWGQNTSEAEQAEWLRDAIQYAASTGQVDLIIVFNVNYTRFVDGDPQGGFAIIRPDGSCPACEAIAQLRSS
ncbi:MAG: hypothetical protein SF162_13060 [bacterium]|nr:hypothetical protein [bacterium]